MNVIKINGKSFPAPDEGMETLISTVANSTRNANGKVVAQKVCRDQYKLNNLQWFVLDAATWAAILKEMDHFFVDIQFPDPVNNKMRTLTMYPGDRTGQGIEYKSNGLPARYKNCKVNLVDVGR